MLKSIRSLVILLAALGLTLAVLTNASAGKPRGRTTQSPTPHSVGATDDGYETNFVPITPCRAADTRRTPSAVASHSVRVFAVRGADSLTFQGGPQQGCGIPEAATAITANVTVTGEAGNGYLTGYATGTPAPLTNFVSYRTGLTTTVNPTLRLAEIGIEPALSMKNNGATVQVIIDVTGYYVPPIEGYILANGEKTDDSVRILRSTRVRTGFYQVTVDRDVVQCAVTITPEDTDRVAGASIGFDGVIGIIMRTSNEVSVNSPFDIVVTC